jgi:hypothetical protein
VTAIRDPRDHQFQGQFVRYTQASEAEWQAECESRVLREATDCIRRLPNEFVSRVLAEFIVSYDTGDEVLQKRIHDVFRFPEDLKGDSAKLLFSVLTHEAEHLPETVALATQA